MATGGTKDIRPKTTCLLGGSQIAQRLTERWLLVLGVLFVLLVFFFPKGVLGKAREALARRRRTDAAQEASQWHGSASPVRSARKVS